MEAQPLSTQDLKLLKEWAQKMKDTYEDVESTKSVIDMLVEEYSKLTKSPKLLGTSKEFVVNRAKSAVNTRITGTGALESFQVVFWGPQGPAKNWNADHDKALQERAKKGQNEVYAMMKECLIAKVDLPVGPNAVVMPQPVSKLLAPMVKVSGKYEVRKEFKDKDGTIKPGFELWKPGDPVIPIDNQEKMKPEKGSDPKKNPPKENWNYTNELKPRWAVTLTASVIRGDSKIPRITSVVFNGDCADPDRKKLIENELVNVGNIVEELTRRDMWMLPIKLKAELDEKKSKDGYQVIKCYDDKYVISSIGYTKNKMEAENDPAKVKKYFDIYSLVTSSWAYIPKWTNDPFDGIPIEVKMVGEEIVVDEVTKAKKVSNVEHVPGISIVDLLHAREFHEKIQIMDNKGQPITYKKKDRSTGKETDEDAEGKNYSRIACFECTMIPGKEPGEGRSINVKIKDNSLTKKKFGSFLPNHVKTLPFSGPAADVLVFAYTTKKATYYDNVRHENLPDEDGTKGDISLSILGTHVLYEFTPEEIGEEKDEEDDNQVQEAESNKELMV